MEIITRYWNQAVEMYGPWGLGLMALILVMWIVQLYYYLGLFGRLPSFKLSSQKSDKKSSGTISVVAVIGDDYLWVEEALPRILKQDHPMFEVVAVYIGTSSDFGEMIETISAAEPRFRVSRLKQHPLFPISTKMALNIGIKAARYDNIVITTPEARPVSQRWLSLVAKGFEKGDVLIGYCGIEPSRGLTDKIIRSSRMFSSLLYITAAIRKRPYRGTIHNMGFARELYFEQKGFGHLNLNLGEDDLFLQQIFTKDNYTVVIHPRATVRQARGGGLGWWLHECRLRNHTFPFYPLRAKSYIEWEAASRLLFFAASAAACVLMPLEVKIAVGGMVASRYAAVVIQMGRVAKRLGEKGLMSLWFIGDLFEPLVSMGVALSRIVKPIRGIWR